MDKEKGLEILNISLAKIESSIKASGGIFNVQTAVCFLKLCELG
jgi:hypothetical protein